MSIGDVNSQERGSGARFNDGKLDLTYLPPWCWEELAHRRDDTGSLFAIYGEELRLLINFWEGDDESIELVIDGLTDEDYEAAARVLTYGAGKYAPWNWAKGMPWSVPMACYLRHMLLADPESADDESGISHRGHAVCNLIMLAHFAQLCRDLDDRPVEIRPEWHEEQRLGEEPACGLDELDARRGDQGNEDLPQDLLQAVEEIDRLLRYAGGKRERVRSTIQSRLQCDPDRLEILYYDEDCNCRSSLLLDLPTNVLNEVVERATEEQESRDRCLRATGYY